MGGGDSYAIGPGILGFLAFFVMAIALWLLVRNMSGRLRRMAYQERDGIPLGQEVSETGGATSSNGQGDVADSTNPADQLEPEVSGDSVVPDEPADADEPHDPDGPGALPSDDRG